MDDPAKDASSDLKKEKERVESLKLATLKQVDLFKQYPDKALQAFARSCKEIQLKKGDLLCVEGEEGNSMYVIISGKLEIFKMKKIVDVAQPGEYIGEMALIDFKPRSATVKAAIDSIVMKIDEEVFEDHIIQDPRNSYALVKTLSNRARHHLDVISQDCQTMNCFVHDMRNILVALDLPEIYLSSLMKYLNTSDGDREKEGFNKITMSLKKIASVRNNLTTLIEKSLTVAKKNKSEHFKEMGFLLPLVDEIIEELESHQSLRGKIIKVTSTGDVDKVNFSALDIKRVLQNLIINAGYASQQKDEIEIVVLDKVDFVEIKVIDQGCGIPDDVKPHLLKTRYTTKDDGNGFGLLSCREIIEDNHQGMFWFDSEEGVGTKFHFTLPR
jgi:signal transduction histidine kinase